MPEYAEHDSRPMFMTDDHIAARLENASRRLKMLQNFGDQLQATLPSVAREIRAVSEELDQLRASLARG